MILSVVSRIISLMPSVHIPGERSIVPAGPFRDRYEDAGPRYLADMDRHSGTAIRRATARIGGLTLTAGLMGGALAGCQTTSAASPASASPSPGLSIPGTHRSTTEYRISSPVSTVIVISHAGNVTVTGGGGSATSVTQDATYSKTPPVTTRTVSGGTLTITYSCPLQLVCGVGYVVQVPRDAGVQVSAAAGTIRLSGLAGSVTAKADVGLIDAIGLTGASVALTTEAGGITAAFATSPATVQAVARVGAITLRVPGGVSYRVSANAHVGKATVSVPQGSSSAMSLPRPRT